MKKSLRLQLIIFVAIRTVINSAIRMVYPYSNAFAAGLGVDEKAFSLAVSLRSAAGMFGPFLAPIADRRGRRTGMLFGLALFSGGAALMIFRPTYPIFIATLSITLLGNFVFTPAMQAHLGDRVPYSRRGLVLAITELGWSLAFIVGMPAIGFLIGRFGWQAPFPVLSGLGILSMLCLAALLPKEPPPQGEQPGAGRNSAWRNLGSVFRYSPAVAGLLLGSAMSAANELVNLRFAIWMRDAFQVELAALAVTAAVIGVSELGGEALAGGFVDRLGKPPAIGLGITLNCLAALALPLFGRSVAGAMAGLFFFYITFEFTIVCAVPLMTEIMPARRATLMACFMASLSAGRALGALLSPFIYSAGKAAGSSSAILAVAIGCVAFNLLALGALGYLRTRAKAV